MEALQTAIKVFLYAASVYIFLAVAVAITIGVIAWRLFKDGGHE